MQCTSACAVSVRICNFFTYGRRDRIGICCGALGLLVSCIWLATPDLVRAQGELSTASEITFARIDGDQRLDQMARSGLFGLSDALFFRTSVEPSLPVRVDVEFDELAFYPFLYWPAARHKHLSPPNAIDHLTDMRQGGVIVFDSRDGGIGTTQTYLRDLLRQLDIPPLDPLPKDHVMNRTFTDPRCPGVTWTVKSGSKRQ